MDRAVLASAPDSYVQSGLETGESGSFGLCEIHSWVGSLKNRQVHFSASETENRRPEDSEQPSLSTEGNWKHRDGGPLHISWHKVEW